MDKSQIEMLVEAAKAFDIILAGVRMELGGVGDEEALEAVLHVRSVMHTTYSHDEPREEVACIMERAIGRVKPLLKERDLPKVIRSSVPNVTCEVGVPDEVVLVKFSGGGVRAHIRGSDLADRINWISVKSLQKHYRMPNGSRITAKTLEQWQKILPS